MREIHNIGKHSSQETRKMLFRGFGKYTKFSGGASPDSPWLNSPPIAISF